MQRDPIPNQGPNTRSRRKTMNEQKEERTKHQHNNKEFKTTSKMNNIERARAQPNKCKEQKLRTTSRTNNGFTR